MIYLDSAATTLQKPPSVPKAVAQALATMTSPGRGNYGPAARASQTLLACREAALIRQAAEGLSRLPEVQVYAAQGAGVQTGVLSFRLPQKDPGWVAEALSRRGIAVRAGLHCAPLAHATGGTEQTGTVRVSVSAFNTSREITAFLAAMQALV